MNLNYSEKEKLMMLDSGRKGGFVADRSTAVSKEFIKRYNKQFDLHILDFGAGKNATQTINLRKFGYVNTYAYDFKENMEEWSGNFDHEALNKTWDVILLSNVINIQPSLEKIMQILNNLMTTNVSENGVIIFNYPKTPRYTEFEFELFERSIKDSLDQDLVCLNKKSSIYSISKGKNNATANHRAVSEVEQEYEG